MKTELAIQMVIMNTWRYAEEESLPWWLWESNLLEFIKQAQSRKELYLEMSRYSSSSLSEKIKVKVCFLYGFFLTSLVALLGDRFIG
jgi:hypothetical protein